MKVPEKFDFNQVMRLDFNFTGNWNDIAYNWLIGEDGNVYEGRGWTATGGHTRGYNSVSTAVSVLGNYMTRLPNAAAMRAIRGIIACGVQRVGTRSICI